LEVFSAWARPGAEASSAKPKGRSAAALADPAGKIRRLQREILKAQ